MDTASHSVSDFISPEEFARALGTPSTPLVLDVRREQRFAESDRILPGAQRCAPGDVARFLQGGIDGLIAPQAAGLLAVSLGMSRLHEDDHQMLDAMMPIYDALYAWCREGRSETHTWKSHA